MDSRRSSTGSAALPLTPDRNDEGPASWDAARFSDSGPSTLNPKKDAGVVYPVYLTAAASTVWYSSGWVTTGSRGYIVIALPTALGRQQIAWNLHYIQVQHLKTILGSQADRVNYNIEQQFVCHVVGAFLDTGVYNMESWQPSRPCQQISNPWDRCNRIK